MSRRFALRAALAIAIGLPALSSRPHPLAAQDAARPKRCYACRGAGLVACTKHKPETGVERCTVYLERSCCNGLDFVVCGRCQAADVDIEEFKRKEVDREKWMERARKFSKEMGEDLVIIQSPHFYLSFGIEQVKANKRRYDKHAAAHLYAERLEKVYAACQEIFREEAYPREFRFDVHLFATQQGCTNLTQKLAGTNPGTGWKLNSQARMVYTTYENPAVHPDDEDFHEYVAHSAAHLLIRRFGGFSANFPAWIENGFASYIEWKLFEGTRVTCFTEQPPDSPWKGSDWKEKVRKSAQSGDFKRFDEMADEPLDSMDYRDHAFAFSYVDFLVSTDRAKFVALVRELQKEKPDSKAAIKKTYGWIVGELEDEWRKFASRG